MRFSELNIMSNFTFLKGGSSPEEYAQFASLIGLDCIAIADENSVAGLVRAHTELEEIYRQVWDRKNFEKKCAYTIRCGGKGSPINDRHNWDGYLVDGEEYRLTIDDAKKLQGFDDNFIMTTKPKDAWRHLGNTIPTIFTKIIADKIEEII